MSPVLGVTVLDAAASNLTSVPVLAFALGVLAARFGAGLRLPSSLAGALSAYLLFAIGLKGGGQLRTVSLSELVAPALVTLALGVVIPVSVYRLLVRRGRFSVTDAACMAAHYGSVSAVTFTAAVAFAERAGEPLEASLPALLALLEVPAIVVALVLAARDRLSTDLGEAVREALTGKSVVLLVGGIGIGVISGPAGLTPVAPVFVAPFTGVLALFLLDLGGVAGEQLGAVRKGGRFLLGFALAAPVVQGSLGVAAGTLAGMSVGGATVLGVMAASASYIAAPAAVRVALPDANLGMALAAAVGITFPFNLVIGIPGCYLLASALA